MAKRIVILSSSPRVNSNSDMLAREFEKGAKAAGHDVCYLRLREMKYEFCRGCLACSKLGHCVVPDDASAQLDAVCNADVLVFATPVYFCCMSGQLRTFLDRQNPLYHIPDYKFRQVYVLAAAAEDKPETFEGLMKEAEVWTKNFKDVELSGSVLCGKAEKDGDAAEHPDKLKAAYDMGFNA